MTKAQVDMLRRLVSERGLDEVAADARMSPAALLRVLSEAVPVREGTQELARSYLGRVKA
jgi:hypothetical protein